MSVSVFHYVFHTDCKQHMDIQHTDTSHKIFKSRDMEFMENFWSSHAFPIAIHHPLYTQKHHIL